MIHRNCIRSLHPKTGLSKNIFTNLRTQLNPHISLLGWTLKTFIFFSSRTRGMTCEKVYLHISKAEQKRSPGSWKLFGHQKENDNVRCCWRLVHSVLSMQLVIRGFEPRGSYLHLTSFLGLDSKRRQRLPSPATRTLTSEGATRILV